MTTLQSTTRQILCSYGLYKSVSAQIIAIGSHSSLAAPYAVIIVVFTQALGLLLGRIRQPRVIAEVIGGVFLGPSVLGRIPGFTARIFPDAGAPFLSLTSTIGLVLFLFLVGLEIDVRVVKRNFKASLAISVAGLIFPLGLGAALGVAVYREFINPEVNFGYFVLFCAVAVGITAFPVLCRILTELKVSDALTLSSASTDTLL